MASLGIDLLTIQLMGRWGSDVVLRYVAEVPLSAVTKRVVECFRSASINDVAKEDDAQRDAKLGTVGISGVQFVQLQDELNRIKAQLSASASSRLEARHFVVNEDSHVVHALSACLGPTWSWSIRCGWSFAKARSAAIITDPDPGWSRCATCYRLQDAESDEV